MLRSAQDKPSIRDTAALADVPPATLHARLQGRSTRRNGHQKQQLLTEEEEDVLAEAILKLIYQGFPPTRQLLRQMALTLANHSGRTPPVTDVGKHWPERSLGLHEALRSTWSAPMCSIRAAAANRETVSTWLTRVKELRDEYGIHG